MEEVEDANGKGLGRLWLNENILHSTYYNFNMNKGRTAPDFSLAFTKEDVSSTSQEPQEWSDDNEEQFFLEVGSPSCFGNRT